MSLLRQTRIGLLELHFGVRGVKTLLLRDLQKAPLMIVRPFELPCGTLMAFIVNPTGGVMGGDHSEIRVQVDSGARVLILTQSATRVQPSPTGEAATQDISFTVQAGARLEYYPERTIPFAGSCFRQRIRVILEDGAEFGATETLAAGRVQSGERLAFGEYQSRTEIFQAGNRVFLDKQKLKPSGYTRAPGVWGQADYGASGVWVGAREMKEWPKRTGRLTTGHSAGGAVWLRAVAERGPELDADLLWASTAIRQQLFGATPLQVRR